MHHRSVFLLASVVASSALALRSSAQVAPLQQQVVPFPFDSGTLRNDGDSEAVVFSHTVRVAQASWLRLRFQQVQLWHPGEAEDAGAFLRITSHLDGAVQELHAVHAREWQYTSAYFNGDTLQVDLVLPPHSGDCRVALRSVWMGPPTSVQFSQCGSTDDRVASNDARIARVVPIGCTAFLFDDCQHCFATAGHCTQFNFLDVAEFNVPLSTPSGAMQHPGPDDQYAVDDSSQQKQAGGVGNDWGYFGVFANPNTGLTPFQRQGACFNLVAPPTFTAGAMLRVTGYGLENPPNQWTQTQQTDAGPWVGLVTTQLQHQVDTEGGNSGSPLIWEANGTEVIGVHTHGGCTTSSPPNFNSGTASTQANWVTARANPLGVCAPAASTASYCTSKVNSLGCTPLISSTGAPSAVGGAGSFSITASALLNQKNAMLFYGYLPASAPFGGGFKCVAPPTIRTAVQSSGGSPSGSDCSGTFAFDMGARIASGVDPQLVCGAIAYAQVWSRDPQDAFKTSLTAGLRFTIGP